MTLSQRVLLTLAAPIFLVLAFAFWFWPAMSEVAGSVKQVREQQLVASNTARDMTESVIQVQQFLSDISATQGKDGLDDGFDKAAEGRKAFIGAADQFKKLYGDAQHRDFHARIDDLLKRFEDYYTMGNKMAHAYIDGGVSAGNAVMAPFDKASESLQEKLKPFVDEQIAAASTHLDHTERLAQRAQFVAISLILFILAACAVLGWSLLRFLKQQLGGEPTDAAEAAQRIAQGDLTAIIRVQDGDKGSMMASMHLMQKSLAKLVADISAVVVAAEAGDLSQRLDTQRSQGFARDIGVSLNALMETADTSLRDISKVAGALAAGDLSQSIAKSYPGTFGQTALAVNATVNALNRAIDDVRAVVQAASESDYSVRMETSATQGYIHTLGELLNRLTSVTEEALVDIQQVASAMANGNLNQRVQGHYPGLLGMTADGVNTTVVNLRELISEVVAMVDAISQASAEIANGNQDLARRTSEQAASLEKAASSVGQLSDVVRKNSAHALEVNTLVKESAEIAESGGTVVRSSVETMAGISGSAQRIGDIVGVIDSIAFQTNLLALNAAVEAARAGDQGRGFAVVATEVRALAQRSAEAAKEIKGLISTSLQTIHDGTTQVNRAGNTMDNIVTSISRVTGIMAGIATASAEQTQGIGAVNDMVVRLDDVTQQNAALVEQMAAAAESLQHQANLLQEQLGKFRLQDDGRLRLAAPPAPKSQKDFLRLPQTT